MEKLVYLTWKPEDTAIGAYGEALLGPVAEAVLAAPGVRALDVGLADLQREIPKPMLLMGEGATVSAAVSLWMDCLDARGPIEAALRRASSRVDGYLVTESVPQPCTDRDWSDGARSPGVSHFTWFPKPEGLDDDTFFHAWHEVHTPFSFELHPRRWSYTRNSVTRTLTPGSPRVSAIVVERFREIADYTDPDRLFGSKDLLARSAKEASEYADMSQMHSVPLSETIVKSLGA
jgi:hypothetical protein